jgi:toxin ParE1/3/4
MNVRLSAGAREELLAAAAWYEDKRAGLGVELMAHIDAALVQIADRPESCSLWRRDRSYRSKVLTRFPYVIVFAVEADVINVIAIAHTRRQPGYWRNR